MQFLLQAVFCGIFMKLYVYKIVKNNKADEKRSCWPSLLVTVMLYISPGVSASSKLNSNKNKHGHISSLIGLLCFQGSSSLSSRVSKRSWLSPFYKRGQTGTGFRWLAGCHGYDKWQKGNRSQASEHVLPTIPHWPSTALLPCPPHQRANQQLAAMSPTKASL